MTAPFYYNLDGEPVAVHGLLDTAGNPAEAGHPAPSALAASNWLPAVSFWDSVLGVLFVAAAAVAILFWLVIP